MNAHRSNSPETRAFTRTDLIALIAIAAVLLALALPVFGRNLTGARAIECLANKQELMRAWAAFAGDHDGTVPGVLNGSSTIATNYFAEMPWARGWITWDNNSDNTNVLRLTDPIQASLSPYLNGKITPFKCPADTYVSASQKLRAWTRLRSVSANTAVGPGNAEGGPWDTTYFRHVTKISQFTVPSPADTWVYIDEHPDSINDPAFYSPTTSQWVDLPAGFHDRAAGVAMADGSAQMHYWRSSKTVPKITYGFLTIGGVTSADDRADIAWLRDRTPHR